MLYFVVERFRGGDAAPVYRRFRERGRLGSDRQGRGRDLFRMRVQE